MYDIINSEPHIRFYSSQSLTVEDPSEVWSKTLFICNITVKKGLLSLHCPLVTDRVI